MADKKIGPKLEYTYGLPRKRLYAPINPPPARRVGRVKADRIADVRALVAKDEEVELPEADPADLPEAPRGSPVLTVRLTPDELAAIDSVRGERSRNSFVRYFLQQAVKAIRAREAQSI